jgi:PIN domain nuclease of toxin-antitoxin system
VRVLLDTHALLWFSLDDTRLSICAKSTMMDRNNDLLVSPATLWEVAIKVSLGKYELEEEFTSFFSRVLAGYNITLLPVAIEHAAAVTRLPFHHRDPFDRMLVAQAIFEDIPIVSADRLLDAYSVTRIW